MNDLKPDVKRGRNVSPIWIVPIVAVLLGIWMVGYNFYNQGTEVILSFSNADDLIAGKTKIKYLSVEVGQVEGVILNPEANGVLVKISLEKGYKTLLRKDTRFWVERVRIGAGGISGLSTILSGAYIKLAPGEGEEGARKYVGLESPPVTPVGAPGVRLVLETDNASSVSVGDPILFHGYTVGRVESMALDEFSQSVRYNAFVDAPYHKNVTSGTRFWDVSGLTLNASTEGFTFSSESIETILSGGVAFAVPAGFESGEPVEPDTVFNVFDSYKETLQKTYQHGAYYAVQFSQDISGLVPGAPVTYRGVHAGRVVKVMVRELVGQKVSGIGEPIPVLLYLEPGLVQMGDTPEALERLTTAIRVGVSRGLRASLQTGNLLTGSQFVTVDYYPNEEDKTLGEFAGYPTIPTVPSGLIQMTRSAKSFLDTLNTLPLEKTMNSTNSAITSMDNLLKSRETQNIPDKLNAALTSISNAAGGLSPGSPAYEQLYGALVALRETMASITPDSPLYKELESSLYKLNITLHNMEQLTGSLSETARVLPAPDDDDIIPEARK